MNTIITITNLKRHEIDVAISDHARDTGSLHIEVEWKDEPSGPELAELGVSSGCADFSRLGSVRECARSGYCQIVIDEIETWNTPLGNFLKRLVRVL